MRRSPIAALAAVAYAVILADLLTKLFAVALVGGGSVTLVDGLRLTIIFNDAGAFGMPSRAFGLETSTVLTFLLILLMLRVCRELSAVDRFAPLMLGLITGAGAANHLDMLASPRGVADFINLRIGALEGIVFNVADLALVAGLVLCARTAALIVMRILEERTPALAIAGNGGTPTRRDAARSERDRPMPIFREPDATIALRAPFDRRGDASTATASTGLRGDVTGPSRLSRAVTGWLTLPTRFDRAATPALVIACSFIVLYSLAIVWLPDAGRSAPSGLLLALGVFGTVFVSVYAEMIWAERREARRAAGAHAPLERRMPGLAASERTVFDGSLGIEETDAPSPRIEPRDRRPLDGDDEGPESDRPDPS